MTPTQHMRDVISHRVAAGGLLMTPVDLSDLMRRVDSMSRMCGAELLRASQDIMDELGFLMGLSNTHLDERIRVVRAREDAQGRDLGAVVERLDPVGNAPEARIARQSETIQQLMDANKRVAEERDTLVQTLQDRAGDYVGLQRENRRMAAELSLTPMAKGEGNNPTRAQLLQRIKDQERMLEGSRKVDQYLDTLLEHARHFFGSSVVRLLITTPENTPMEECFPNLRKAMVGDLTKMQAVLRQRDELLDAFEDLDRNQTRTQAMIALQNAYYPVKRAILEGTGYPHAQVEQDWAEYITSHDREVMEANEARVTLAKDCGVLRRKVTQLARELEEARLADAQVLEIARMRVAELEVCMMGIRRFIVPRDPAHEVIRDDDQDRKAIADLIALCLPEE